MQKTYQQIYSLENNKTNLKLNNCGNNKKNKTACKPSQ